MSENLFDDGQILHRPRPCSIIESGDTDFSKLSKSIDTLNNTLVVLNDNLLLLIANQKK